MIRYRSRALAAALFVMVALLLSSCADPDTGGATYHPGRGTLPVVKADPEVAAMVPAALRKKGRLVIGTNGPNPPIVFYRPDNKTLTGYTIDLGDAIARTMGLTPVWKNVAFDAVLPGLSARRYDAAMSSFSIEPDRLDSADFVSYYLSGGGFLVKKGSGVAVNSFNRLCGKKVVVKKGASQLETLEKGSRHCATTHQEKVAILQVPDESSLTLALLSGRADVAVDDKPQALYAAALSRGQVCVSSVYQTSHSIAGVAVPKGSALAKPMQAAVNHLLATGAYQRIAGVWGTGGSGTTLSSTYQKVAAPWGVGPDGSLQQSKVFTRPEQMSDESDYYYQPLRKGCA